AWSGWTTLSGAHYDAAGHLTSDTLGDGETESWTYNKRGWPVSSTSTLNSATTYSYNITSFAPNGDILAANDSVNGNWNYSYDQFNRLVGATQNAGGPAVTPGLVQSTGIDCGSVTSCSTAFTSSNTAG